MPFDGGCRRTRHWRWSRATSPRWTLVRVRSLEGSGPDPWLADGASYRRLFDLPALTGLQIGEALSWPFGDGLPHLFIGPMLGPANPPMTLYVYADECARRESGQAVSEALATACAAVAAASR